MGNVGDALTGRAEEKKAKRESQAARGRGLGELSPEAIQNLIKTFSAGNFATMAHQIGGAQGAIRGIGGRMGAQGSGVLKQLQAGVPGQIANNAMQSSIPLAASIAQSRSGVAGQKDPIVRSGLGSAFDTLGAISSK